ncbi:hypothetical protein KGM_210955 [Danaus plexippus plexippus]|uniref:Chitin-binding type-2 domain-containing protein n=1 Tax=Danaus plexippus plexippus TaxID=278856 RepID=A0A212EM99_DANPL|nr:hypothetical protein KGM_210955 [Danaus plexippus plexippus]
MNGRMETAASNSVNTLNTEIGITQKLGTNKGLKLNSTQLSINERYRRLIPYMTFYYANDLLPPTTESYTNNVEVEKAEIIEAGTSRPLGREPKIIYSQRQKDIPRYQGNRLTPFNIASSSPSRLFYKDVFPVVYQHIPKANHNYSPASENRDHLYDSYFPKPIKAPSVPFTKPQTRKPYYNYNHENIPNIQYIQSNQGESPKYKLVPYDQAPPVNVEKNGNYNKQYNVPVLIPEEPVYIKPRPHVYQPAQHFYENSYQPKPRKPPTTISEVYYERRPYEPVLSEPVIESGFKPIIKSQITSTENPVYTSTAQDIPYDDYYQEKQEQGQLIQPAQIESEVTKYRPQYVVEQPPTQNEHYSSSKSVALADLLNSLQINKSIPKPITRENVGASIKTLLQVLNALRAIPQENDVETSVLSTPKPFEAIETPVRSTPHTVVATTARPQNSDIHEPLLATIHTPSQHIDEYPTGGSSSQRFPLPVTSEEEGGTPGKPDVDYPILTVIPETSFNCKTQRYKGFFADPETRCQVWHYCDLNGGQASFLCPNGTIFSQAALTCDWWFNVRCSQTAQLYVLNESLYKYILPHSPKFPEDYSGPLVDKYLSLKFKEMEEQFRKNKNKKAEKMQDDDSNDSKETDDSVIESRRQENSQNDSVNQPHVIVESPGSSGNVQRLQDE